jgi:HK97 family phage major capsid protein
VSNTLISTLKENRKALKAEAESILNRAEVAGRSLNATESRTFDTNLADVRQIDERISELEEADSLDASAVSARARFGGSTTSTGQRGIYTSARAVYGPDNGDTSYFRDLITSRQGDLDAAQRLQANNSIVRETRAGDLVSVTATQGGVFAAPLWAIDQFVALARPHRVTADALHKEVLPKGIASINLPKIAGGSGAGVQATQNSTLTDTALTSTSVSSGITLIAGKQIVSRQLIDQSGIPFDRVILSDLAADYAKQLDVQVLYGTGSNAQLTGLDTAAGITVTYTTASPKVVDSATSANSFYQVLVTGLNKIHQQRYMPATHIIMAPRRWAWLLNAVDSQGRPLITPSTASFNGIGTQSEDTAEGIVGNLLGLPVVVDPNVSLTANSSTNQDAVYLVRGGANGDSWLYESQMEATSFEAPYADSAGVLFRALGYSALVHRYTQSVVKILGTGLVDPGLG